jgi:hypothetical protein
MLHPHIARFVKLAINSGMPVHIFSNLTIPDSIRGIDVPGKALSLLVNINDRETYSSGEWNALSVNLAQAVARGYPIVLAYTAYSTTFDLSHIQDMAVRHGIGKVRISPAMPMIGAANLWLRPSDMPMFSKSVQTLYRDLATHGKRLVLDCPIPLCHVPGEYLPLFLTDLEMISHCHFGISVDVDLEVGHCYVTNPLLKRRLLGSFPDMAAVLDYMKECTGVLESLCPLFPECTDCFYRLQGRCSAGCYGLRHAMASS